MSDLLKRLDGLANDFKSRAMFNSEAAIIEAMQHIRSLESSGTFAAGVEAAAKWHESQIPALQKACDEAERNFELSGRSSDYGALCSLYTDQIETHKRNAAAIRAISPTPGMVMVPAEKLKEMARQPLPSEMDKEDLDGADWQGGYCSMVEQARAMIEAATSAKE